MSPTSSPEASHCMSPHTLHNKTIGVIVLTADRAALLAHCLTSLVNQTISPDSVIIIDGSYSPNATRDVVHGFRTKLPITYIQESVHSISYGRNLGAQKNTSKLTIYLDDDLTADKNYLKRMRDHFINNPKLTAVMGHIKNSLPDNLVASTHYAYYLRGLRQHVPELSKNFYLTNGRILDCEVMGIQTTALQTMGFPTHIRQFRHDDVELGLRLLSAHKKILFDPTIIAWTSPRTNIFALWSVAFWEGYCDSAIELTYHTDLRAAPYRKPFILWLYEEVRSKNYFSPWEKIWYTFLLISFPIVVRIGRFWYRLHAV